MQQRCDCGCNAFCDEMAKCCFSLQKFLAILSAIQKFNILKTTPTPNKNGSYGTKVGVRMLYAIKVGSYTIFSVKVPLFQGIFMPHDPSFCGIFWEHIFGEYHWELGLHFIILFSGNYFS